MVETRTEPLFAAAISRDEKASHYSIYGMRVDSTVPLPVVRIPPDNGVRAQIVIRRIDSHAAPPPDGPAVAHLPCAVHGTDMKVYRGPGGAWIWMRSVGTFHITCDARRVDVYPDDGIDERCLGLSLVGPVLLFVRHKLGCPSLHASAVITPLGALAFLGPQGQGKSTIAASILRRGGALLTDDALPLQVRDDGVYGVPGPPFMKVWHSTVKHTLALSDDLPKLAANVEKKLLSLDGRYTFARAPVPLKMVYVLDRYSPATLGRCDVVVRTLRPREGAVVLLTYTFNRSYLVPTEEASFLPMYARMAAEVPVRILSYPDGFEYQDAVYMRILQDLEQP